MFSTFQLFQKQNPRDLVLGQIRGGLSSKCIVSERERARNMYILGMPGVGKSKFIEHCLIQDLPNGLGLIDPHSQLTDDLLKYLLSTGVLEDPTIRERVIYVDPAREDYVIPLNLLNFRNMNSPGHRYDVAMRVLETFHRIWPDTLKESPIFDSIMTASIETLIANNLTLMDMPRLLTDKEFREKCLDRVKGFVTSSRVVRFFRNQYDAWGKEQAKMANSTLNKISSFDLNPRLLVGLAQSDNTLDFQKIMDEGYILIVELGNSDTKTNYLIGCLIPAFLELAMKRRSNRNLWNLTIDEFADYVAKEGSEKSFSSITSAGRKYRVGITIAHQDISQLPPRMLGALSNVNTKVFFRVERTEAEYFSRRLGRYDPTAVKQAAKTDIQHDRHYSPSEQWELWANDLQDQEDRTAYIARKGKPVNQIKTITIPSYTATDEDVEAFKLECLKRYGIPYTQAVRNIENGVETQKHRLPMFS